MKICQSGEFSLFAFSYFFFLSKDGLNANSLSQIIRNRNDYKTGTPIRLLSCNVGNTSYTGNCVAQILSDELGVIVKAPTDTLYVCTDGSFYIGKYKNGEMKRFYPRK